MSAKADPDSPRLVGILNVTPDSFSDGGKFLEREAALGRAEELIGAGADLLDVGADSTRPGSVCVGPVEELDRLRPVLEALSGRVPFSVDTHHGEVARVAIDLGAAMINDVGGGRDPGLLDAVARSGAGLVIMHSRSFPHDFSGEPSGDIVSAVRSFFDSAIARAEQAGVPRSRVVLDSGMGAFLSADPARSLELLGRYDELCAFGLPLMLGCSRKGFLKRPGERSTEERDEETAKIGADVASLVAGRVPLYLRVHDVAVQRRALADRGLCR